MEIAQEEVFGPVLSVIHADSLEQAIEIVNSSRYGNGTSIFTESGAAVRHYRHDVEVGMIGVNIGVAAPVAFFPFSGWKGSFFGDLHAHGTDAVEFYTRKKTITSRYLLLRRERAVLRRAGRPQRMSATRPLVDTGLDGIFNPAVGRDLRHLRPHLAAHRPEHDRPGRALLRHQPDPRPGLRHPLLPDASATARPCPRWW